MNGHDVLNGAFQSHSAEKHRTGFTQPSGARPASIHNFSMDATFALTSCSSEPCRAAVENHFVRSM